MINTKMENPNTALLNETIDLLHKLDFHELKAIQSVIKVFISKGFDYYKPLSEEEIISRIDEAIAQVDAGLSYDAEEVENEIMIILCFFGSMAIW